MVFEAESTIGGGTRSAELTLPGFIHDVCSAVHPFGPASPFFRTLPLETFGLKWLEPEIMLAHPFDDGTAATVFRSVEKTASGFGRDAAAYQDVIGSVVEAWPLLQDAILGPLRWPQHPFAMARFGIRAIASVEQLVRRHFAEEKTRALVAGVAAHAMLPLDVRPSAAFALVLAALAHVAGWVIPVGGAQRISDALAGYLTSLGARSSPARQSSRSMSSHLRRPSCAICRRSRFCESRDTDCRRGTDDVWNAIVTAWLHSKWIGRSMDRFRGALRRAAEQERCTSGRRCRRWSRRNATRGTVAFPIGHLCCCHNRQLSICHVRQRAATWCGRIATSPMHRRWTCCHGSNSRLSDSRQGSAIASSRDR